MFKRRAALTLMTAATVFGQQIHLKTRNVELSKSNPAPSARRTHFTPGSEVHRIVQFDHAPAAEDIDALARAGAQVLNAIPDNALVVSIPEGRILPRRGVLRTFEMSPEDKLSPSLPRQGSIEAIIEFHPDIAAADQQNALRSAGLTAVQTTGLLSQHVLAAGTFAQFSLLADEDSVAYIFPADASLANKSLAAGAPLMPCAGMLTTAGPVGQYANIMHGWDPVDGTVILNYVFGHMTPAQPSASIQSEIVRALNTWSQAANLIFRPSAEISAVRTVYIWFASGSHGDAYPFSPGALGHTFYPVPINPESIAGDMHLNLDQNWNIGGDIDIYSVALHEAGHAIGLGHSDNPGDVMYPYYRPGANLSSNDIAAAVALYGPAVPNAAAPDTGAANTGASGPPVISKAGPASQLNITLNPPPASTDANTISLSGTVSGGVGAVNVEWQTDHSSSGAAAVSNGLWTASSIPLAAGINNITITAFDASHGSVSQTATISLIAPASTKSSASPISIRITSPAVTTASVNTASITLTGETSGGSGGIAKITWQTLAGASGIAIGTGRWVASNVPLLEGTNTIVVRAFDGAGASAWASLIAVRN